MPPVVAVLVAAGWSAFWAGVVVYGMAAMTVASIGYSVYMMATMKAPGSQQETRDRLQTIRSSIQPHRIIYGEVVVGGALVYAHSWGDNHKYISLVVALAGHECEEISDVWLGDTLSTDAKFQTVTPEVPAQGYWDSSMDVYHPVWVETQPAQPAVTKSFVTIAKFLGDHNPATVFADLIAAPGSEWTAAHTLTGISGVVVTLEWDSQIFPTGLPNIKAKVKGRKMYDPRTELTAWSDNWALCVGDYLRGAHGLACLEDEVHTASWIAGANVCDELVALSVDYYGNPATAQKRYRLNGSFTLDKTPMSVMQSMLSAAAGSVVWTQGQYRIYPAAYYPPDLSFYGANAAVPGLTESDLRDKLTVRPKPSRKDRFNGVRGTFVDPQRDWQPSDFAPVKNATYAAEDGEEILQDLSLDFTTDGTTAQRLAKVMLERHRQSIVIDFPAKMTAFPLSVNDTVPVTIAQLGWSQKIFRVVGWELAREGGVNLQLQEEAAGVYDWNSGEATTIDLAPNTNLPDPWTVPAVAGVSIAESLYRGNTPGDIKCMGVLTWTGNGAARYVIQVNGVDFAEIPAPATSYTLPDLIPRLYVFGVVAVNSFGVRSPVTTLTYTVLGKTAPPPAPSSFLVTRQPDGTRDFSWATVDPPIDLAGFRIRYISGTSGEWASMLPLHDGLLTSSPYETNQLAAGDYVVALVAEDTTGNQSAPVYIETTLEDPRLADVILDRYPHRLTWPGTLGNCYLDERGYLVAKDQKTWTSFPGDGVTWATWTSWARDPYDSITYTDAVMDLGVAVAFTPFVSAQADGSVAVEMRTSDDNSTWSDYAAPAFATKRYVQFRLTITNAGGLAVLKSATIYLSGRPVVAEINDLDTSTLTGSYRIGTGDVRLPVAGKFAKINTVLVTLQNVGAGWSYELIDKTPTYGPRIKIYNASGVLADAIIDAYIKGV